MAEVLIEIIGEVIGEVIGVMLEILFVWPTEGKSWREKKKEKMRRKKLCP